MKTASGLGRRPVASIAVSLGELSERWLDRNDPYRRRASVALGRAGYDSPVSEALLDALFSELTAPKLLSLLREELGDPAALDGFVRRGRRFVRAHGPGLVTHVLPGNVPNPSVTSLVLGLLTKSSNALKVSRDDCGLLGVYLDSLKAHDAALGAAARVFSGHAEARAWARRSGLVVAYGTDETLAAVRAWTPANVPFQGYGHRVSFGVFTRETLGAPLARVAARDAWMMNRRGCLSPSVFFVESGGETGPYEFASLLSVELNHLYVLPPRAALNVARVRSLKKEGKLAVSVWFERAPGKRPLDDCGLVTVRAFRDVPSLVRALSSRSGHLQAAALEAPASRRAKIAEALSALGVNRVCRAGKMQEPPVSWHHDGRPNLAGWIYWTDLE